MKFDITKEELEYLLINKLYTHQEIASLYGVSRRTVGAKIKALGIVISEETKQALVEKYQAKAQMTKAQNLFTQGTQNKLKFDQIKPSKEALVKMLDTYTIAQICDNLGVSTSVIKRWEHEYGIQVSKEAKQRKIEATKLSRYGDPNYFNRELAKQTMLDIYGVAYSGQSAELVEKANATKQARYGNLNNYEKIKSTNLARYGVSSTLAVPEFREKAKRTMQSRYASYGPGCGSSEQWKQVQVSREVCLEFLSSLPAKPSLYELSEMWQISYSRATALIRFYNLEDFVNKHSIISQGEQAIFEFLQSLASSEILRNTRGILPSGQELDLYLPEYKLAIEYDGCYWHSDEYKSKNYHFNKSKEARDLGIRLIHIYENEWLDDPNKIKALLQAALRCNKTLYARKCRVTRVQPIETKSFLVENHTQGYRPAQVAYGLYYKDLLVQVMTFSASKYNYNTSEALEYEVVRECSLQGYSIVGGVSKLLVAFRQDFSPAKLFSYCDFNKFNGKSYEACGFVFTGYTGPDMKWLLKDGRVVNRNPSKNKELKEASLAKLWGAGSLKYALNFNKG